MRTLTGFLYGLALIAGLGAGAAAMQRDPFEDATVAVRWKENAKALALIESRAFDVNRQDAEGYTLLHFAADQNNLEIARELLKRGADPNIKSRLGFTVADMSYSGSPLLSEVLKAGGKYARIAPPKVAAPAAARPGSAVMGKAPAPVVAESPRRKLCNARHYSSSALCSDSTCKMREYRKWNTCLKTGSYY
jgi:hypothetical protein